MSIVVHLFKVTQKSAEVAEEIAQDQQQRQEGFEEQVVKVVKLVERLIDEEGDIGRFEKGAALFGRRINRLPEAA